MIKLYKSFSRLDNYFYKEVGSRLDEECQGYVLGVRLVQEQRRMKISVIKVLLGFRPSS